MSFEMCAASLFEGETRDAIIGLKYRNERRLARDLALLLLPVVPHGAELLTWAPTATKRRMARGVDHAELIVRHLGALTGVPVRSVLRREGDGRQTGSTRGEREVSVRFVARGGMTGTGVVVVDDVVTTGATMRAAVSALAGSGFRVLGCLAVAMVP